MTHTKTERMILQTMQHPFLMTLQFAFQSEDKLYMVLEYMKGGELFHWLRQAKRFTEDRAKLYGAEILLALAHLHSHDIVYRDLKPENILMDEDGHLRLTDFGLSKESVSGAGAEGGTKTFCGTPEYLAPEILENRGHGKAVDWWSLGVLIYEMMVGRPPFYDKNMQKMYSKVRGETSGGGGSGEREKERERKSLEPHGITVSKATSIDRHSHSRRHALPYSLLHPSSQHPCHSANILLLPPCILPRVAAAFR